MQESDNIQVLVRVRPPNTKEQADGFTRGVDKASDGTVLVKAGAGPAKPYAFDHVVDHTDSQQTLFESVGKPIAESCLQGYHGCLLAYGQTGAGKTFTMQVRSRASRVRVRVVGAKVQPLVNHPSLTPTPRREPLVLSQRFTLEVSGGGTSLASRFSTSPTTQVVSTPSVCDYWHHPESRLVPPPER
jgi:hypothetical protein